MALGVEAEVAHHVRVHLARAGHLEPAAGQRPAAEGDVDLGAGLGEREEARPEAHVEVVGLEELAHEVGEHDLQVLEADVLADPQAFALVEHRRMRGVAVDAVGAARRDDADLGHRVAAPAYLRRVRAGIAHLHRAGVRAQVEPAALGVLHVDVEGVLHRPRRVVLGVVQRGEAHPVGLDLGALGHVEAHRAEDGLDALDGAAHRVQAAGAAAGGRAA